MSARYLLAALLFVAACPATSSGQEAWWNARAPGIRPFTEGAETLAEIRVQGNRFVDAAGDTVVFRGVSIADPDKLEGQGHWGRAHFEHVRELGATLVRIPVHPVAWRARTPAGYLELLDQAVAWCTELGMHVIIDWHSIGNLHMELFQDPMYDTTQKETFEFWRAISRHYAGHNTVAFYELFNEPTIYRGQLGSASWSDWRELVEDMIGLIRAWDSETIPLVSGFDWAYDLTPLRTDPVRAEGIAYTTHPYEHKRTRPWEPKWDEAFGFAAATWPVMVTEFGFAVRPGTAIEPDHYAHAIIRYLEDRGMSWVAWVYDAEWWPRMLRSWDTYELTPSGEFFGRAMRGELGK